MPIRDFIDSQGNAWRAWDVNPDKLSPGTRDEDYLAHLYQTGWIVFEAASGRDKRRLYPIPRGWGELPDAELEVLLRKAEVVPSRKLEADRHAIGPSAADAVERAVTLSERMIDHPEQAGDTVRDETPDVTDLSATRTFRYPRGRLWTVSVMPHPESGGAPVLRFTAGSRYVDLAEWPKDWVDLPDPQLAVLLRSAVPRGNRGAPRDGTVGRRWDDRPTP